MLQPSAPAREPTAWIHAPSQPLMRSLLSQFQTPTAPRRVSRFFRVWLPYRSPRRADHSAYFGLARFISPILSAVDASHTKQLLSRCQRKSRVVNKISVHGIVENRAEKSGLGSLNKGSWRGAPRPAGATTSKSVVIAPAQIFAKLRTDALDLAPEAVPNGSD